MGHRKHSAPRRGSLAFRPRGRVHTLVPSIRFWGGATVDRPTLLGHAGFKAGALHVITVDDREKTPNFGKPFFNAATIIATPPITICGFRAYRRNQGRLEAVVDVFAKKLPKDVERKVKITPKPSEKVFSEVENALDEIVRFTALAYTRPRDAGLAQKKPFLFEIEVGGGDNKARFEYLKSALGKEVKASEILKPGMYIDVAGVTKGKGFEGPVKRFGVKRKQHKSRKSVRAVAVLGPWHPAAVTYTVPRAGQRGFHKRTEYNKRILAIEDSAKAPMTPKGGFDHFGVVRGEYVVLKGSVPGPAKRLIRFRYAVRPPTAKTQPPKILETSIPVQKSE